MTMESTKFPSTEAKIKFLHRARQEALAAHELARTRIQERITSPFKPFKIGDQVWLDSRNLKTRYHSKMAPRREGPFEILEVKGPLTYRLRLPEAWKIHDTFHITLLMPFTETDAHGPIFPNPTPELIEGEEEYEVEAILRHKRIKRGKCKYLVKWSGYPISEASWEPEEALIHAPDILNSYKRRHKLRLTSSNQSSIQPTHISDSLSPININNLSNVFQHYHHEPFRHPDLPQQPQQYIQIEGGSRVGRGMVPRLGRVEERGGEDQSLGKDVGGGEGSLQRPPVEDGIPGTLGQNQDHHSPEPPTSPNQKTPLQTIQMEPSQYQEGGLGGGGVSPRGGREPGNDGEVVESPGEVGDPGEGELLDEDGLAREGPGLEVRRSGVGEGGERSCGRSLERS